MAKNNKPNNEHILLLLLVVAVLFSMGTTLLNFTNFTGITGAATAVGTTNLTILSTSSITNNLETMDFGSGYTDGSVNMNCQMASDGRHNQSGASCIGFNNVSSGFLLENTGNSNLSINYSCSGSCNATSFIGDANGAFEVMVLSKSSFPTQSGETGTADTGASCFSYLGAIFNGWNITDTDGPVTSSNPESTFVDVSNDGDWLCGNSTHFPLGSNDLLDAGVVHINLSIPSTASGGSGMKNATFTFNAISS